MSFHSIVQRILRTQRKSLSLVSSLRYAWRECDDLGRYRSLSNFLALEAPDLTDGHPSVTLDLGCGVHPKNPFRADRCCGVDLRVEDPANSGFLQRADLSVQAIPFPDAFFNYATAFDFLEHIPRVLWVGGTTRFCFVELMNEIYRVLKPQGVFLSLTPAVPTRAAFADPTHVNYITAATFPVYFSGYVNGYPSAMSYGFRGDFDCLKQGWIGGHLASLLRKVER
ncbi:MAG: methyltransferase domain-containing protein [Cyanobacteria bacterium J06638_7]